MKKLSKIFVAGGTGLVGSAIIQNLLEKGYTNIVSTKRLALSVKQKNNNITLKTNSVHFVNLDLLDTKAVEDFFKEHKPEFVFFAAAKVGGIVANNTYRADFIYENLQIQNNIIHQSYVHKVKKLLFLGSTCIYPKNAPQPMKEDSLLSSELEYTNEPYAIAKIAGVKMCESYNIQYGTNFISVMPTNLYGKNDNYDLETSHVLPALLRKIYLGKCLESVKWEALSVKKDENWEKVRKDLNCNPIEGITGNSTKEEIITILNKYGVQFKIQNSKFNINLNKIQIEIWGSGNPRREFMYSKDMADACIYIMENVNFQNIPNAEHLTLNAKDEIRNTHINIGTGEDISIKELAYLLKNIVGYKGDFIFNASKPDGTLLKRTDTSKLNALGWKYKMQIEEGIEKVYEWYKNERKQ
ncbi:MAG: GDP-L-fucose synthase [Arcobacteraceae bacterium]